MDELRSLVQPEECSCCRYKTEDLMFYKGSYGMACPEGHWLCFLCANTMTGMADQYSQYGYHAEVMKTICFVGNVILAAIREGKHGGNG